MFRSLHALAVAGIIPLERAGRARHENVGATALKLAVRSGLADTVDHRLLFLTIVAGTVVAALLVHRFVELPLLRWSRAQFTRRRTKALRADPA